MLCRCYQPASDLSSKGRQAKVYALHSLWPHRLAAHRQGLHSPLCSRQTLCRAFLLLPPVHPPLSQPLLCAEVFSDYPVVSLLLVLHWLLPELSRLFACAPLMASLERRRGRGGARRVRSWPKEVWYGATQPPPTAVCVVLLRPPPPCLLRLLRARSRGQTRARADGARGPLGSARTRRAPWRQTRPDRG